MKIRKTCGNRGRSDWLKDKISRGYSVEEPAKTGKCEVTEPYLEAKQNLGFFHPLVLPLTAFEQRSDRIRSVL